MLIPLILIVAACALDTASESPAFERQRFNSDGGQSEITILIDGSSSAVLGSEAHAIIWIDEECQFARGSIRLSYASFLSAIRGGECATQTNINIRMVNNDERLAIIPSSRALNRLNVDYFTWENSSDGVAAEYLVGLNQNGEVQAIINMGAELFAPPCETECGSKSVEVLLRDLRVDE